MPEYRIIIENKGGSSKSPTKPKSSTSKPTKPKQDDEKDISGVIKQVGGFIQNPDSLVGMAKGAAIAQAGIVGVVLKVAYDISMKVADTSVNLHDTITGDYTATRQLNNFRTAVSQFFTPFSTSLSHIRSTIEYAQVNDRNRLSQQLLGDSVINQNYNRKV